MLPPCSESRLQVEGIGGFLSVFACGVIGAGSALMQQIGNRADWLFLQWHWGKICLLLVPKQVAAAKA